MTFTTNKIANNKLDTQKKDKKSEPKTKNNIKKSTSKTSKKETSTPTTKKATTKKKSKQTVKVTRQKETPQIVEYYDLPYRYNQTIVKLLYQTPTTLFVYWDISDEDRENYKHIYGENFFEITRPVLIFL